MDCGGLEVRVRDSFSQCPTSFRIPHCPGFVFSPFHRGESSGGGDSVSLSQGVVEPAPPSPGFYSHMFVVTKAFRGWRAIIDLSTLNLSLVKMRFRMETA